MTSYILLERIKVEDANCIAGFTYGYPALTSFLGFTHAISRKINKQCGINFTGCAIFNHDHTLHINEQYDVRFIQSKRPPVTLQGQKYRQEASKTPPIIEEGKMDLTVSLLLQCDDSISGQDDIQKKVIQSIKQAVFTARLAGGSIQDLKKVLIFGENINIKKIKRTLLPSFVLLDATDELKNHVTMSAESKTDKDLFDLWTDFFAFKEKAQRDLENETKAEWVRLAKPKPQGWFVPLMIGYKGISPLYDGTEIEHNRDPRYSFRFVESVHGIGEWRSTHRIQHLDGLIWKYHVEDEWYLCKQNTITDQQESESTQTENSDDVFSFDFE